MREYKKQKRKKWRRKDNEKSWKNSKNKVNKRYIVGTAKLKMDKIIEDIYNAHTKFKDQK